ncbi:MAG: hypothetical protein AAF468_20690 [Pseudomonadota bacterium]
MVKKLIMALGLMVMISACTSSPKPSPVGISPKQQWCDHNRPRRPSLASIKHMSDRQLDTLNAHNRKGEAWCGWKP